ncbi:MAG: hypothetical protein ACFFD4_22025 [Candidatus Odinarchaeota archaeon]
MGEQLEVKERGEKSRGIIVTNVNSRLERLYNALSLEYEQLKVKLEEMDVEKNDLIRQLLQYTMNKRLVKAGSLEKTRNLSRSGEELDVYFQAGQQLVNLNCSFLHDNGCNSYSCNWKTPDDKLVSCVGCTNPKVFVK